MNQLQWKRLIADTGTLALSARGEVKTISSSDMVRSSKSLAERNGIRHENLGQG